MAPTKANKLEVQGISTRSKNSHIPSLPVIGLNNVIRGKRKADGSPGKEQVAKRSALGDLTNAVVKGFQDSKKNVAIKKVVVLSKNLPSVKTVAPAKLNVHKNGENIPPPLHPVTRVNKILTRAAIREPDVATTTIVKPKELIKVDGAKPATRRISNEFEKTEDSLYVSALEDVSNDSTVNKIILVEKELKETPSVKPVQSSVPIGVDDFDKENWLDTYQVSEYAMDIFNYLKIREPMFSITDYMDKQVCLSRWMRSLLVDWMVEVQESFELNHETLYLAVKLVDLYLVKKTVGKETLQLLGAAALFIASKFDERIPPLVDDFLYICDGAYTQKELLRMEMNVLKIVDYDLGIPLSYRFLRRYARCAKVSMPTLTLARYILEFSLMDYETIMFSDSKIAAAALLMALKMKNISGWTPTLEHFTGYFVDEILPLTFVLNAGLHRKPKEALKTVRNKYSHKIFFEVAKVTLLSNDQLQTL